MTVVVVREKEQTSLDLKEFPFVVQEDTLADLDEEDAVLAASAAAASYTGEPDHDNYQAERLSNHSFRVRIIYQLRTLTRLTPTAVGAAAYSFDYRATPFTLTYGLATLARSPGNAPDLGGLLSSKAEPIAIHPPPGTEVIEYVIAGDVLSSAYRSTVRGLLGRVNGAPFLDGPAGTIMLVGANGRRRSDGETALTFHFARGEFRNYNFGGGLVLNNVSSFVHIMTNMVADWDPITKFTIPRAIHAYAVQVFPVGNLNALNLPAF